MNVKTGILRQEDLATLKCPSCTNITRRRTDRPRTGDSSFTSPRIQKELNETLTLATLSKVFDEKLSANSSFVKGLREALIKDIETSVLSKFEYIIDEIKKEFQTTTNNLTSELTELRTELLDKSNKIKSLETEQVRLRDELERIHAKVDTADRLARGRNVEIQCVPEGRNENVITLFQNLCKSISVNISENDIHACRRVAKTNSASKRPRNIVVTLSSVRLRDSVLSAIHRFNKAKRDKLQSEHLGIKGEPIRIFVSEHLSLENKQLHAAARQIARTKNYKFVWVRNNKIYLRKDETSNPVLVKNLEFLNKI